MLFVSILRSDFYPNKNLDTQQAPPKIMPLETHRVSENMDIVDKGHTRNSKNT